MKIELLISDVDGTLTDGKIYTGDNGELCKAFNIKDGYGIRHILPKYGIKFVIITGRESKITERRCEELGINLLYQGVANKVECLSSLLKKLGITFNNVAYIGDDLNDLAVMSLCGIKGCPADAAKEIKAISDFISTCKGGEGAVREFIEFLIQ